MKNKRRDFQSCRGWRKEKVDEGKKKGKEAFREESKRSVSYVSVFMLMQAHVTTCVCPHAHVAFFLTLTFK